jgi:hypothetical protein
MNPRGTFCMIFGQHLCDSLLLAEEDHVFKMFIILTALSDFEGVVEMSRVRLAQKLHMTRDKVDDALDKLSRPDPESRSQTHEGRRVLEIGQNRWLVVNRKEYSVSGRTTVRKELKSADNRSTYNRRKAKNGSDARHPATPSQKETDNVGDIENDPHPVVAAEDGQQLQQPAAEPVKTPGKVKFRTLHPAKLQKADSGLNQPESTLTSTSASRSQSPSQSRSDSSSESTSRSSGRGESERGNHRSPRMPAPSQRSGGSDEVEPHWMKMFTDPADQQRLERDVEIAMSAASIRFAITPDDAQQARRQLSILCKHHLLGQVMKTIQGSGKDEGQSLSSFLEYYFSDQLPPAPRESQAANRNPFEEELEEELDEELEEDSRSSAFPSRA